jgi:hypothetical protein
MLRMFWLMVMVALSGVGGRRSSCNLHNVVCSPFLLTMNVSLQCHLCPPPRPNSHFGRSFGTFSLMKNPNAQGYGTLLLMKNPKLKAQAFAVPWCKRKMIMPGGY